MKQRALRLVLASTLALSLVPALAFAEAAGGASGGEYAGIPEPEYQDTTGEQANSFRFTDGIPDNVIYEENEKLADEGIQLFSGAFSDVGDSYRSTWSRSNGKDTYTYRETPNGANQIVSVPGVQEIGIDVSYHNNSSGSGYRAIDWNQVKADGITFAIIRCAYGNDTPRQDDTWFARNYRGAKAAGLKVGVYLYSYATRELGPSSSAEGEARHVLRVLKENGIAPQDLDLPVYYDMEDKCQASLDKGLLGAMANRFCSMVANEGFKVGIYANKDWWDNRLTAPVFSTDNMKRQGWGRWVARYPYIAQQCGVANTDIWQFTSIGLVNGTPRRYCDVNFAYTTAFPFSSATSSGLADTPSWTAPEPSTRWVQSGSTWYLRDANGNNLTGWQWVNGAWYYMNGSGVMQTGWLNLDGTWYYLASSGAMQTGWQLVGGTWYYFHGSGAMATGWLDLGGTWYYLSSSGAMATGWLNLGGTWYYLNGSGAMQTGWQLVGGAWYYLSGSGAMQTGWLNLGGTWYYLHGSGAMATGWLNLWGTWYYLNGSGAMVTGWLNLGGTWYYLSSSGAMATGWLNLGGTWYYLYGSGAMASNCWIGNYYVGGSGAMLTDTWIGPYHVNSSGLWDATR